MSEAAVILKDDPLWYKDAIIYELHIKSFFDSDGNGIGDFQGLIQKLDYLQDLGVTALWLLPFYPSPLRDDGYDIADYMNINPDYGGMRDFKIFLREAHVRGLRVITELVLNHTSDQHEWFQKARHAKTGSKWREYYVWSDSPDKYADARIIFKDFEASNWSWDPVAKAYYWHRFYHHQPDLNFENPQVHKAMFRVIDFWLKMGVDGVRLDAVPYLYEEEGSNCENLPRTYEFLQLLRKHLETNHKNKMLLAEANQWPEDSAKYFGDGDSCHMAFHFPLMPRMFMSVQMEDRYPIIDILEQTPDIPENAQWAVFLRNHDELTLEMVTDEERDYMYRMYARDPKARINLGIRRRLAPLLGNDRRKMELLNILLFAMPGTPVLYYGDEIGMGDNYYLGDRDGVRTPMQWSADRNAGFSRSNPQRLFLPVVIDPEYHYEAVNVETQQTNKSSLLWWMKKVIALRKRYPAFGRGAIRFLLPENPKVLTFVREFEGESILVVCNLSRFAQAVTLNLAGYEGHWPQELFSRVRFPQVRSAPYTLTLNPYGYYLFSLTHEEEAVAELRKPVPEINLVLSGGFLGDDVREALGSQILPLYLQKRKRLKELAQLGTVRILEAIPMGQGGGANWLLILEAQSLDGQAQWCSLIVSLLTGKAAQYVLREKSKQLICIFTGGKEEAILVEGFPNGAACGAIMALAARQQGFKGRYGELSIVPGKRRNGIVERAEVDSLELVGRWIEKEGSSAVICGDSVFFKVFQRVEEGVNPDIEILQYLSEQLGFLNTPLFLGEVRYTKPGHSPMHVAMLNSYVRSETDAWSMSVNAVGRYYEGLLAREKSLDAEAASLICKPVQAALRPVPELCRELVYEADIAFLQQLGQRVGELHLALAKGGTGLVPDERFAPDAFSTLYQRSVYQSMQSKVKRALLRLESVFEELPEDLRPLASEVMRKKEQALECLRGFLGGKFACLKIRVHGNLLLHNIHYTGRDFMFVNFEGKAEKPVSERRLKRSSMRDVGDVIRSLHHVALEGLEHESVLRPEDRKRLEIWANVWWVQAAGMFLRSYLEAVEGSGLVPDSTDSTGVSHFGAGDALGRMLDAFLLEKAFVELLKELDSPAQMGTIPLKSIITLLT